MEDRQDARHLRSSGRGVLARLLLICLAASSTFTETTAVRLDNWFDGANQIPFISSPSPFRSKDTNTRPSQSKEHEFQLRHVFHHGVYEWPDVHVRMDVDSGAELHALDEAGDKEVFPSTFRARSQDVTIQRLTDRSVATMQSMYHSARLSGLSASLDNSAWALDEVQAPNTTDKETVVNLAKMSWCAYVNEPGTGEWQDIGGGFNYSQSFGWEGDSLRGHVFADSDNSTIVIALKGTSPGKSFPSCGTKCWLGRLLEHPLTGWLF